MANQFPPYFDDGEIWMTCEFLTTVTEISPRYSPHQQERFATCTVLHHRVVQQRVMVPNGSSLPGGGYFHTPTHTRTGSRRVQTFQPLNPVQPQAQSFVQSGFMQNHGGFPGEGSGFELRSGGGSAVRGGCGGTGVFLPVYPRPPTTTNIDARKQGMRAGQAGKRTRAKREEESHCQVPPELALPQEWDY